jgi:integrase
MSVRQIKLKSGNGYKAVVTISPTKQISKNFKRKIDAESWEREQRRLLESGKISVTLNSRQTVSELAQYWMENYAKPVKSYSSVRRDIGILNNHILPYFGTTPLAKVSARMVELWLSSLRNQKGQSPKSCNNCLGLLRKMFNDAVRWQYILHNPVVCVMSLKIDQQDFSFWTKDEVRQFLSFIKEKKPEYHLVYAIALYCGLRRGEMKALDWDCVGFQNRLLTVKRSYCYSANKLKGTKNNKIRRVPMNQILYDLLVEVRSKKSSQYLMPDFDFNHSHRITRELAVQAGVKSIRFHDLRHTFASNFMMAGGNIYDLQQLLGHSTIKMTERYSHLCPKHLIGKTDILNFEQEAIDESNVINFAKFRRPK